MKTFLSILTALILLGVAPAMAGEQGRGGHGGGGCGGGCGGGAGGGGHDGGHGGGYGGNINVNVNANANANANAGARAGASINARAYDVGSIGNRGPGYGGTVVHGSGGVDIGGYGGGYVGAIVVTGAGYGPSRPFGYVAQGFGRRYVTTDRCCGLRPAHCYAPACGGGHPTPPLPPPPPPPSCHGLCDGHGSGYGGGYGYGQNYSGGSSGSSYSVRESYSESSAYAGSGGYQGGYSGGDRYSDRRDDGPRYAPIPYHAAPLEPVAYEDGYPQPQYAPPEAHYPEPSYAPQAYAPPEPQIYQPAPVFIQPPDDFYGDLPPGDTGEGMPYRQEPGERG